MRATALLLAHRVGLRVGRRGAALLIFGFIDEVVGYSLLDSQSRPTGSPVYRALEYLAPYRVWAFVWISVGVVCAVQAFAREDWGGFASAVAIKVVWAGGFLAAWVLYGAYRAWVAAATWGILAALVYLISGWPEPRRRPPRRPPTPRGER